jgi:hypothetical protein
LARIRLLSTELDAQRQFAVEREKTQGEKASFILVAATLVAGLTFAKVASSGLWALGLLPVGAALGGAICATVMLLPRPLKVTSAGALVDKWVDAKESPADLEDYLLESKRAEITQRDERQRRGAGLLRTAFILLLTSIALVIVIAVVNGFLPDNSGATNEPGRQACSGVHARSFAPERGGHDGDALRFWCEGGKGRSHTR